MAQAKNVQVKIQWCGGWGYADKFRSARDLILQEFPDGVDVISAKDPQVTGNFEIFVNGNLIHSKKTKNHGFLHSNEDQQKVVFDAITKALGK